MICVGYSNGRGRGRIRCVRVGWGGLGWDGERVVWDMVVYVWAR